MNDLNDDLVARLNDILLIPETNNRSLFPPDEILIAVRKSLEEHSGGINIDHESAFQHSLLAPHVTCIEKDGEQMALVITGFTKLFNPPKNMMNAEKLIENVYMETSRAIKFILMNIPGMTVTYISMDPTGFNSWALSMIDSIRTHGDFRDFQFGNWYIKYKWNESIYQLNGNLDVPDIADIIFDLLRDSYIQTDREKFNEDLFDNHMIIQKNPFSPYSFKFCLSKTYYADYEIGKMMANIYNQKTIIPATKMNRTGFPYLIVNNENYLGGYIAVKEL